MDQRHPPYFNNTSFLTKGSQVEVSSDEDGFNAAWFVATVIHPPPSISTTKKNKSLNQHTNNLVYVEYHNLLSEDGSSRRLREYANVSYVRPSPHPDTNAAPHHFQLNDLVDAFYRDGWWTGVITAVVDSSNFVVTFQNPPDHIQFKSSDLRVHRRWDGGRWVQPEIQRTAGLMFTVGKKVELCFEEESLHDVWFPATVVENLGNNTFLVEYQQPGIGDETTVHRVTVDYLHIRPSPPHLRDKNFVLLEKVDAYYDFGWWSGVITKELADNRYNVSFKHTKKEREFDCSRVRPHMEWKGGKWFTTSQRSKRGKGVERDTPTMDSATKKGRLETELRSWIALGEGAKETRIQENDVTKDLNTHPVIKCDGLTVSQENSNVAVGEPIPPCLALVVDKEGKEGEAETVASPSLKRKRGRPPKLQAIRSPPETPVAIASITTNEPLNHENGGVGATKASNEKNTSSHDDVPCPSSKLPNGNLMYSSMKGKPGKRRTINLNSESPDKEVEADKGDDLEASVGNDESLSKSSVQSAVITSVHGTEGSVERRLSAFADKLPFMISTPTLWMTIESMEAFQKIPQRPHFQPLEGLKESAREGLAIGCMVTFSTVVDKTCALRFQDPRRAIEECLETLAELETHGFQVALIRDRLTRLLLIKDKHEELEQRSKGISRKLEEGKMQAKGVDTEMDQIDREIAELKDRRRQLLSDREKHESEMGVAKAAGHGIHLQLRQVALEFDGLAAAPFVSSSLA